MTDTRFELHPRLAADCATVGELTLCSLLLMNDRQYPWFILVPRRAAIREIYELSEADQQELWRESAQLSRALMQAYGGDKLNVAALGNLVPQLHLHHIVRFQGDAAWPAPVWGRVAPQPYSDEERAARLAPLQPLLGPFFLHPPSS